MTNQETSRAMNNNAAQRTTIDDLMERLRAQMQASNRGAIEAVQKIVAEANDYLRAVIALDVAKVELKLALPSSTLVDWTELTQRIEDAALALQSSVAELPELRQELTDPVVEELSEVVEVVPATYPALPPLSQFLPVTTHPDVEALMNDFRAVDFDALPNDSFRWRAEEFACRGRLLQEQKLGDSYGYVVRIIRTLTAKAIERKLRDIFGLALHHKGNWTARIARAQAECERIQSRPAVLPSRDVRTPLVIPDELRTSVAAAESEDEELLRLTLPLLRAACFERPLVLLGGSVKQEKLNRLKQIIGSNVQWVDTADGNQRGVESLARRVREGRISAVVILEELIGHAHFSPVAEAARQTSTPLAYGAKAGKAMIIQALADIEKMLASASSSK